MTKQTYIKNKQVYNMRRGISSIMNQNPGLDENRALEIFNINKKIKEMKKLNKLYKETKEYNEIFDRKLTILGFIPEIYKENLAIQKIIKLKKLDLQNAKDYYYLSKQLKEFPKNSEHYKNIWEIRKKIIKNM